jgi:hypothetical protein
LENRKTPTFRINSKWDLWVESCCRGQACEFN